MYHHLPPLKNTSCCPLPKTHTIWQQFEHSCCVGSWRCVLPSRSDRNIDKCDAIKRAQRACTPIVRVSLCFARAVQLNPHARMQHYNLALCQGWLFPAELFLTEGAPSPIFDYPVPRLVLHSSLRQHKGQVCWASGSALLVYEKTRFVARYAVLQERRKRRNNWCDPSQKTPLQTHPQPFGRYCNHNGISILFFPV